MQNIVADMRKVLAKHPQVEQRRLHRRVFFESVAPENQALMVIVHAKCIVLLWHADRFEQFFTLNHSICSHRF
jgi:MscS family membrane protein